MRLFFSNTANQLSLSAGVVASDTILLFGGTATGWPSSPCKAVIDPDTDLAEVVLITAIGPSSFTVARGQDGTAAQNHVAGALVEHRWSAAEADEANVHANLDGGVHGITGDVVGTDDVQTLENKHIISPTVDTATFQASDTSPAQASKAATTGTANIAEFQDPSGVRLTRVGQHGEVEINTSDATIVPLLIKGDTGLSRANIEVHDDVDHVLYQVDSKGRVRFTPQDASASIIRYVPPNGTDLAVIQLRNATDTGDEFVVTTLGRISNAATAAFRGNGTDDVIVYPLDGTKFKVDKDGDVTAASLAATGAVTANNLPQVLTADAGKRIEFGTFDVVFTSDPAISGSLVFPTAFSSATGVVVTGTVQAGSNFDVCLNWQADPTASSVSYRVFQKDGNSFSGTVTVHWIAVGPS